MPMPRGWRRAARRRGRPRCSPRPAAANRGTGLRRRSGTDAANAECGGSRHVATQPSGAISRPNSAIEGMVCSAVEHAGPYQRDGTDAERQADHRAASEPSASATCLSLPPRNCRRD
jgi:hypothetical protein